MAVILAMPTFGPAMRAATTLLADATFLAVPAGSPAALIITIDMVFEGHYSHPSDPIVVLMQNRSRALYLAVLTFSFISPLIFLVYKLSCKLKHFFSYFTYALLRRAHREGLSVLYFWKYCNQSICNGYFEIQVISKCIFLSPIRYLGFNFWYFWYHCHRN